MANTNDILLDADGDFLFKDGDFVVGFSTQQEIEDIVISAQGWWKASPLTGVNIRAWQNAPFTLATVNEVKKKIKVQLEYDGMKVNKIEMQSFDKIIIDAQRT